MIIFTPLSIYFHGNSPNYPLNRGWVGIRISLENVRRENFLVLPRKNPICPVDQSVAAGLSASHSEVQLGTLGTRMFVYCDFAQFLHTNTLTVTEQTSLHLSTYFSVHRWSRFQRVLQYALGNRDPSNPTRGGPDNFGPTIVQYFPFQLSLLLIILLCFYLCLCCNYFVLVL